MITRSLALILVVGLLGASLQACSCGPQPPSTDGVTYQVPSGGGSVEVPLPSGDILTFAFPASAAGRTVFLTPVAPASIGWTDTELKAALRMEPDGMTFPDPVLVIPSGGDLLLINFPSSSERTPGEPLPLAPEGKGLHLSHFSTLGLVWGDLFCQSGGWTSTPGSPRCSTYGAASTEVRLACHSYAFCFSWVVSCCKTTGIPGCGTFDPGLYTSFTRLYSPPGADWCGTAPAPEVDAGPDTRPDAGPDAGTDAGADAGVDAGQPDAGEPDAGPPDAGLPDAGPPDAGPPPPRTYLRVGHLVPDLGGPLDFCLAPEGGAFSGPYMASVGEAGGLAYGELSEYAAQVPGQRYTVRAVAAGATDCATPLPGTVDLTTTAAAELDERRTLALVGERAAGSPHPLAWRELLDDSVPATGSQMKVRFLHASPGLGPVDLGASGGVLYQGQLQGLPFGALPTPGNVVPGAPAVDARGYLVSPRWAHPWTFRQGSAEVAMYLPDTWRLVSAFLVGKAGSATVPLGVLSCMYESPTSRHRSNCILRTGVRPTSTVRVVHLAPGAPAVDFCVRDEPSLVTQPLLRAAGQPAGVAYGEMTRDFPILSGGYDLVLVPASPSSSCADAPVATGGSLSFRGTMELLQTGFSPATYEIWNSWPANQPSGSGVNVRFRNAVPFFFAVDFVGTPSGGTASNWFTNMPYNRVGVSYVQQPAGTYTWQIRDNLSPRTLRATSSNVVLGAGEVYSTFFHATGPGAYGLLRCEESSGPPTTACSP